MWKNNYRIAYSPQNRLRKPLSFNGKESFSEGRAFAEENGMVTVMDNVNLPENGLPQETGAGPKRKRKVKKHCPVCGKRLYQDGSERWYCPHCQAEVDGDRISFNFVPEGELDTLLQTG